MKQGDLSITEYFTKLRIVWDEIENFRPDLICLKEQYSNVRSHILLMDPFPTISKIFSYVAQQERQLLGNNLMTGINLEPKGSLINVVKSTCDFCGQTGHTENVCYKKHGLPSNYDGRSKGSSIKSGNTCTHCGKNGHTVDVCYRKHGFPQDTGFPIQGTLQTS